MLISDDSASGYVRCSKDHLTPGIDFNRSAGLDVDQQTVPNPLQLPLIIFNDCIHMRVLYIT